MSESKSKTLLEKVQEFCTSNDFETEFESFAKEFSSEFADSLNYSSKDEHPHSFHDVYRKYLEHFESQIETFIDKEGYTAKDFYAECKEVLENEDVVGEQKFFVEALLGTSEYDTFFNLMKSEMYKYMRRTGK